MKTGPQGPVELSTTPMVLLDLRFLELDVLARDRVVLLLDQLVGHGARVLLGDVIEAGIRRGNELDLDGDRLAMFETSKMGVSGAGQIGLHLRATYRRSAQSQGFRGKNRPDSE